MNIDQIKGTLEKAFPDSMIEVADMTGGGDHFQVIVVSSTFEGQSMIEQHQLVYKALKVGESEELHALALKTYTPQQWSKPRPAKLPTI